jgi:ABC-2 type transport system permease protein
MAASPIADLSYRNYDGPIEPPLHRWWAIARMGMTLSLRKKGFWWWALLSAWWYLGLIFIFYFADSFGGQLQGMAGRNSASPEQAAAALFRQVQWKDQFLHTFSYGQLLFFILALLIGVGAVANDNRANALLVYLSKPCTKLDYIIGKWLGIFIPITFVVGTPMLLFYGYCLMSYRQYGFTNDPWLILKLLLIIPIPGAIHASIALGMSALFKQGRLAGAAYAGLYFFTLFFTKAMQVIHVVSSDRGRASAPQLVDTLSYASVDGIQIGLAKGILGTDGGFPFPFMGPSGIRGAISIAAPNVALTLFITLVICGLSILLAWSRIRAVEVVS